MGGMRFVAVSTFNCGGLALYGGRMMQSFERFWPIEVPLRIYSEGWGDHIYQAHSLDLETASHWLSDFKARHRGRKCRDFRFDAVKFAHKAAAVCHAARNLNTDYIIWLDGDVVTHSPVSLTDLENLVPKGDEWIAWLDRGRMYPECGFYIINCRHSRHKEMIDAFQGMYEDDKLFALAEWHDSFVLQHVVKKSGIATKSLSGEGRRTTHPLVNGPLGAWFDHLKGNRKRAGKSRPGDLKIARSEGYWQ